MCTSAVVRLFDYRVRCIVVSATAATVPTDTTQYGHTICIDGVCDEGETLLYTYVLVYRIATRKTTNECTMRKIEPESRALARVSIRKITELVQGQ